MKKVISFLMLMAAVMLVQPMQAQSVSFGAKGGFNITNMSFDKKVFDSENRVGFFVGPVLKVSVLGGLGFDIAALYDQRESKLNDETVKQKSVLVPVNARLNIGLGSTAGIYLAAGPQFGFNVGDDEYSWTSLDQNKANIENTFQLKKSNFSVNLGAGAYLMKHLEVGFAYNIAISKTGEAKFKDVVDDIKEDSKPKTWTISAAYYF